MNVVTVGTADLRHGVGRFGVVEGGAGHRAGTGVGNRVGAVGRLDRAGLVGEVGALPGGAGPGRAHRDAVRFVEGAVVVDHAAGIDVVVDPPFGDAVVLVAAPTDFRFGIDGLAIVEGGAAIDDLFQVDAAGTVVDAHRRVVGQQNQRGVAASLGMPLGMTPVAGADRAAVDGVLDVAGNEHFAAGEIDADRDGMAEGQRGRGGGGDDEIGIPLGHPVADLDGVAAVDRDGDG